MSKTLLIGPAGCGKTHRLLDAFEKSLSDAADPLRDDRFFIVPSAEHTERVISLLIQRGLKGFFHKRVTTLSRLADDLFRVTDIPVASSLTRTLIVRDLIRENAWDYFEGVWEQPGFTALMAQCITELKEACIPPEVFRERMNRLKGFEPAYGAKYEALAAFYEQYETRLQSRGFRDRQDALRFWRERKKKGAGPAAQFRSVWIDGFFDFSNLQLECLRELSKITEDITVTLTVEDGQDPGDAFDAVLRTRSDLEKLGFKVEGMKAHSYRTGKASLLFLQKNLFSVRSQQSAPEPGQDIQFMHAIGTEGEIELIAREIHRLYAAGNCRYSDFAVLFRQIRHYAPVIASVFSRYGIPVEIHERERLKFSSWIAATTCLLSIFRNQWQREDLFAFLKSAHTRRSGEKETRDEAWIVMLEQRSFAQGVTGTREAWLADWKREGEDATFDQKKSKTFKALAELEDRFRAASTAEEHGSLFRRAVYDTFGILEVSDRYTVFNRRDAACVKRFEALLDEIRGHFMKSGVPEVSFESFADYFLGLVELDVYSLHERDKNRVQVYDVSLARQKEYKVVFVAGLLEKVFPMQVREDPLLSDWERKLLSAEMEHPLSECLPRQNIERFFFYLAVTRARERLYLSCPHLDFEGKESLPSFYLEEVKRIFGDRLPVIRQDLACPFPKPAEAVTRREREIAVVGALRSGGNMEPGWEEALEELSREPQSRERLLSALRPVEAKITDEKILTGRYFDIKEISPTRLETYAKCPYRYFADRVLRLKDTGEDVAAMRKGSILHHVLQQYFDPMPHSPSKDLKVHGACPGNPLSKKIGCQEKKKDPAEALEKFIEREIEEGLKKNPMTWREPYEEALDRRELFEMLLDFLEFETARLKSSSFKPFKVEYAFGGSGEGDASPLVIEGAGKALRLRGRVDRIDRDASGQYAVVIDYKRSSRFKASDLELGTALQLPLYLLAAQMHLKLKPLGGEIYSIRDHTRSGFYCGGTAKNFGKEFSARSHLADEVFQRVLDRSLAFVRKFTQGISSSEIPVRPRDCESFCPFDTVCRVEKWRLPLITEEIKAQDRADPWLVPLRSPVAEDET